ncbi:MAG: maleylpyruvate isomerase family mycothiol-dependent enzyme [Acidimicrobiales bacterium]
MDRVSYLESLGRDADDLFSAAATALAADVPTCPGWTVERLVGHVGRVYRWTAGWITAGSAGELERPPAGDPVVPWARAGLDEVAAALAAGDSGGPATVATWAGEQPASFWPRRMAIETALHRWDAQLARGDGAPVGTPLALDGIDELFDVILPWRGTLDAPDGATVHLHATDVEGDTGEWLVTFGGDGMTVEHAHAKGDLAVRATASNLLLLLWNRVGPERCEVFGDASLLERWRAEVTF